MSVEYDLISDASREGYELGKGPWANLEPALRSADPVNATISLLVSNQFDPVYAAEIAREIVAFTAMRADWRVINDFQSDISVMTDDERDEMLAEERAEGLVSLNEDDFPIYRKVGSRYRKQSLMEQKK